MTFLEYQAQAMRSASQGGQAAQLAAAGLGVAGEAGEVADIIKKVLFHGHPLDAQAVEKLEKEAGDVLWYLALLADRLAEHGVTLDTIAQKNIAKLLARYPNGFEASRSLNRPEGG
jgi:NTP pyrophosphatase (non-canonical NTP hydrolase)